MQFTIKIDESGTVAVSPCLTVNTQEEFQLITQAISSAIEEMVANNESFRTVSI